MRKFAILCFSAILAVACETLPEDSRDALVGTWTCKETSQTYTITVSKAEYEEDKMYFDNLYNVHQKADVTISGSTLSIPEQTLSNWVIKGSGTVNSSKTTITLNYTADTDSIKATLTKNN